MRILITGGAGYIGTELVHSLIENEENEIIIYDNLSRNNYNLFLEGRLNPGKIRFIHGDILDSRKLKKVLDGIELVIHLAAKVTTPYSDQDLHQYEQVNHWGTSELVYHIEQAESVKKIIYLSSASVYGLGQDKTADEESEPVPNSHYGLTKLRAEKEVQRLSEYMSIQILRVANVFGYSRSMRFDSVINRFMFDAHYNKKIKVYGDGAQVRPFISIDHLVNRLVHFVKTDETTSVQNLMEFNLSINEIIQEGILKTHPGTEILFISQDLPLKSLELKTRFSIKEIENDLDRFREYLNAFKTKFTF